MHMYAASPHHPDLSVPAISGQEDPDRGSLKSVMNDKVKKPKKNHTDTH